MIDFDRMAESIEGSARCAAQLRRLNGGAPADDSPLADAIHACDTGQAWSDRPVAMAVKGATAYLALAESHLRAIASMLRTQPLAGTALRCVARAELEACAYAHWLLAPGVPALDRAARAVTELLHSLENRSESLHKAFARAGKNLNRWDGEDAVRSLRLTVERLGLELPPRPRPTDLAFEALPVVDSDRNAQIASIVYRLWSGGTHPDLMQWLNSSSFFAQADDDWSWIVDEPVPEPGDIAFLLTLVLAGYDKTMKAFIAGAGWDPSVWNAWVSRRLGELLDAADEAVA